MFNAKCSMASIPKLSFFLNEGFLLKLNPEHFVLNNNKGIVTFCSPFEVFHVGKQAQLGSH